MKQLNDKIITWLKHHNIDKLEPNKQYLKIIEEVGELARGLHPTQKPIELMEYLVKSHTVENDIVLDFTMGSGSTGVACLNTGRKFIGIELDTKYYEIAKERLKEIDMYE